MQKVLIIEDDQFYQKIYKKKFELSGYEAKTCNNGEEGLKEMEAFLPDIVFLDLMMPKMDGFETLKAIKENSKITSIPVVVLTNLSTSEDAQKVLGLGAAGVFVKSNLEPHEIVEKANEILKK